jgi:hypothetical protein
MPKLNKRDLMELNLSSNEYQALPPIVQEHKLASLDLRRSAELRTARAKNNSSVLSDPLFRKACEMARIEPTRRQASKWNAKRGAAWSRRNEARARLRADAQA